MKFSMILGVVLSVAAFGCYSGEDAGDSEETGEAAAVETMSEDMAFAGITASEPAELDLASGGETASATAMCYSSNGHHGATGQAACDNNWTWLESRCKFDGRYNIYYYSTCSATCWPWGCTSNGATVCCS